MKAEVGDRIVVASGTLHRPIRDGEILQTGAGGGGPYLVRWSDSGNESLFFPGPDAHVEHVQREDGGTGGQPVQRRRVRSRPRGGGSTSTSTKIRPRHPLTPCCTVMCQGRSTCGVRLAAARPIRTCRRLVTRWPQPVPCGSSLIGCSRWPPVISQMPRAVPFR